MELLSPFGALQYAHPGIPAAADLCRDSPIAYPWRGFANDSGHLHWRTSRLRWLRGDIWQEGFPRTLNMLCDSREAYAEPTAPGSCAWALAAMARFYAAWRHLLRALRKGVGNMLLEGLTHYAMYLQMKPSNQPLLLQEEQFATLFRTVHTVLSGTYAASCICQFQYVYDFKQASSAFQKLFRSDYTRPGPTGDESRDRAFAELKNSNWCDWRAWPKYQQFIPPVDFMLQPDTDMIVSPSGCYPYKILGSILCGQCAMFWGDLKVARAYFLGAMTLLLFSLDCFDTAIAGLDIASLFDLWHFLARLDASVAPEYPNTWRLDLGGETDDNVRSVGAAHQIRQSRAMLLRRQLTAVQLPPLCLDGQGRIALRVEGLTGRGLYLCDTSGSWSFVPVRVPLLADAPAGDGYIAKILRVDSASWSNLGHSIMFLVPHFAAAYSAAYKTGGLEAVWRRRKQLRVYLYLPREGRLMLPQPRKPAILVPWLELLSPVAPVLFVERGQEALESAVLPPSLELADDAFVMCHSGGEWGGPAPLTSQEDLDLFVKVAQSFPGWQQPGLALLHSVWGRGELDEGNKDVCLARRSPCIRVLLVQRGGGATSPRRIVNADRMMEWVSSSYAPDRVRMAIVYMEGYTYAEEIHLASHTDILIGTFGSGMWWGIFMPAGACLLWISPWLHAQHWHLHKQHRRIARNAPSGPFWGRSSYLEYGSLRDLWHVQIFGVLPPPGTVGKFALESSDSELSAGMTAFMTLDVFVDMSVFAHAFEGIMRHMSLRNASRWANMSRSAVQVV